MAVIIQTRRGTALEWFNANPLLAEGEWGLEIDTFKSKVGDGIRNWNLLPYHEDVSDKTYIHNQVAPSNTWIVNHGLNKFPSVTIVDSGGSEVKGKIDYIDNNNVTIKFYSQGALVAFSGKAYFN